MTSTRTKHHLNYREQNTDESINQHGPAFLVRGGFSDLEGRSEIEKKKIPRHASR